MTDLQVAVSSGSTPACKLPYVEEPPTKQSTLARALTLTTASSLLIPVVGVLSAPLLAQALGTAGRGELAAALAPAVLATSVATMGLPESLTFNIAKRPEIAKRALLVCSVLVVVGGAGISVAVMAAAGIFAAGSSELERLVKVAAVFIVPGLMVGLLRGTAAGHQMWAAISTERAINAFGKLLAFAVLVIVDQLTVYSAILISSILPVVAGACYWRIFTIKDSPNLGSESVLTIARRYSTYGVQIWLGSVAAMLLARIGQVLMVPLSDINELGIYVVAVTISDVPLILALAIKDTMFGISSRSNSAHQLAIACRGAIALAGAISCVIGASIYLWIGLVFGEGFIAAVIPTIVLLLSAVVSVPGFIAASALGAWGRPLLRSGGYPIALIVFVGAFVVLTPRYGAVGAAVSSLISSSALAVYGLALARGIIGVNPVDLTLVRFADVAAVLKAAKRIVGR